MGWTDNKLMRDHLTGAHSEQLYKLDDKQLEASEVYLCRQCEDYVAADEKMLERHITTKHVKKRKSTNKEILTKKLYHPVRQLKNNHWDEGLNFLRNNKFSPPPFRQTLITKILFRLEDNVLEAYFNVIECCVEAAKVAHEMKLKGDKEFDATEIWTLAFTFERLVLAPGPKDGEEKVNAMVNRRLNMFRAGEIQALYDESNAVESRTPADFKRNPVKKLNCVQIAADLNNYGTATSRATQESPPAQIDDNNVGVLVKLHPKSLGLKIISKINRIRAPKERELFPGNGCLTLSVHPSRQ